jgi:hypothetical protein
VTNCVHSVVDYYGLLIIMDRMNNTNIYTQFTQTITWDRSYIDKKKIEEMHTVNINIYAFCIS